MKKITKKQLEEAKKNYKSNYRIASRVEKLVKDLNNEPIFVETICNALDLYLEMLCSTPPSSWYGNTKSNYESKIDIASYLNRKIRELR
jgi:hypothetical protein